MKQFLTILLLLALATSNLFAQKKCKPYLDKEDKFTKTKFVLYGDRIAGGLFGGSTYISLYAGTQNEMLFAQIALEKVLEKPDPATIAKLREETKINKDSKLYLVLENGESLQLAAMSDSKYSENTMFGYSLVTNTAYTLTSDQLKLLATQRITDYRLELSGNVSNLQDKIGKGKGKDLLDKFACALENLKFK
jgi:hypothetical protein